MAIIESGDIALYLSEHVIAFLENIPVHGLGKALAEGIHMLITEGFRVKCSAGCLKLHVRLSAGCIEMTRLRGSVAYQSHFHRIDTSRLLFEETWATCKYSKYTTV